LNFVKERYELNHFIALGSEMRVISKLCNQTEHTDKLRQITAPGFSALFEEIIHKPTPLLAKDYGLPADMAATLLPSMMVLKKCMEMTTADRSIPPRCLWWTGSSLISSTSGLKPTAGRIQGRRAGTGPGPGPKIPCRHEPCR
jgi:hypothetical protein